MNKLTRAIDSLKGYCKPWDRGGAGDNFLFLTNGIKIVLTELERLQKENERLSAEFTGKLTQSPLEMIRAKCEQYWNDFDALCPEEMHVVLEFIHQLAWSVEKGQKMCEPTLHEAIVSLGDHTTDPDRPFVGNHWFQGERGKTEVKGICFRDLADCIVKAFVNSVETTDELSQRSNDGTLNYNDLYTLDLSRMDPIALILNVCCRVEKAMEIYPNI